MKWGESFEPVTPGIDITTGLRSVYEIMDLSSYVAYFV